MNEKAYNLGAQPLDRLMEEAGLLNHVLVAASGEFLTHKVVQKARKGRRLTRRTQDKVVRALNQAAARTYQREHVFNYEGT
jgi:hypothetical protein